MKSTCPGCGYEYPDGCDATCDYKHPMTEWIDVKERLPLLQHTHYIVTDGNYVDMAYWDNGWVGCRSVHFSAKEISDWMELPNPPVPYRSVSK